MRKSKSGSVEKADPVSSSCRPTHAATNGHDFDQMETQEWLDSLEAVLYMSGKDRAQYLLDKLGQKAERSGVPVPFAGNTPAH